MSVGRIRELPYPEKKFESHEDAWEYCKELRNSLQEDQSERIEDFDWLKIDNVPWVDVRIYGAKGDGTTDDTIAIQAAIDSIPTGGGTVLFPGGQYLVAQLNLKSNLRILGESGAELIANANDVHILDMEGTLTAISDLTVEGTQGDLSITLTSVVGLAVDNFILISSEEADNPVDYPTIYKGEIRRIVGIAGNVVSLEGGLWDTYTLVATATVQRVDVVENVIITDMIITGSDRTATGWGIRVYLGHNIRIINNIIRENGYTNIGLQSTVNSLVQGNSSSDSQRAVSGYGVSIFNACSNIVISNNNIRRCRHLTMWGGGTTVRGVPNKILIIGNTLQNSIIAATVDAHALGGEINIIGNTISNSATQGIRLGCRHINIVGNIMSDFASYAISIRGNNLTQTLTIVGNTLTRGVGGLFMHDGTGQVALERVVITGNNFADNGIIALYVNNANFKGALINDNFIDAETSPNGIWLDGINDFTISGNTIMNAERSGIHVDNSIRGVIEGNLLKDNVRSDVGGGYRDSHINLRNSTYITVGNNRYYDATPLVRYLIREFEACDFNDISLKENEGVGYTIARYALLGANTRLHFELYGSATWDAGSIADGDEEAKAVTVTGAALGDFAVASFSLDVTDLVLNAQVTVADTVTCVLANNTGGAIDLASGTVYVKVIKK